MISKFKGNCKTCGKPYAAGEEIYWTREEGAHHPQCRPQPLPFDRGEAECTADKLGFIAFDPEGIDPRVVERWTLWRVPSPN